MRTLTCFTLLALFACDDGGGDATDAARIDDAELDAASDGGRDEPDGLFTGPEIAITPLMLTLAAEAGQSSAPGPLIIQNQGSSPLTVESVALDPPVPQIASDAPPFPATIAPNDALTINYTYTPTDDAEINSLVVIRSNDGDEGYLTVPVVARVAERCIRVSPTELNLGSVNPGTRTGRFVLTVSNCGDLPVNLTDVTLDGPEEFEWGAVGGRMLAGGVIQPGTPLRIEFAYENRGLPAGEAATATLLIESDAANAPRLEVPVRVTGGDGPSCIVVLEPERLEFGSLRIGTQAVLDATVVNSGTADCELNAVRIEKTRGSEENTFTIVQGIDSMILEGGSRSTLKIAFNPVVANPVGDQAALFVEYRDPHIMQNRRAQGFVSGVGAQAQIGSEPVGGINFRSVTAPGCASPDLNVRAANIGFVPLCISEYRLDGDCEHFYQVAEPDLSECAFLEEDETIQWTYRYQPTELGDHRCDILVVSDAMNFDVLRIPMEGSGVETADRRDRIVVGPLDPNAAARFNLSHIPVPATIRVTREGMPDDRWDYDDRTNQIVYNQRNHPARGDEIFIDYEARCFERGE